MKKFMLFFLILCFIGCAAPEQGSKQPKLLPAPDYFVAIDFGHGGFDGGAVGLDTQVKESDLTLIVGRKVAALLAENNVQVILTRTDGDALAETKQKDMNIRAKILKTEGLDAVVSIHMNRFIKDRKVRGPMAFFQAGTEEGKALAQEVIDAMTLAVGAKSRLACPGNNMVTRVPTAPAVLVECGFLSNAQDEENLQQEEYQDLLAQAIVAGLMKFLAGEH
ncbi:MAG: N-acetylmuramoyl-L-alanine amidase [Clostridiales bacterium]|nr:N-acetylmuramoyl-L-alanine amidase [Clostridiales bacterium]